MLSRRTAISISSLAFLVASLELASKAQAPKPSVRMYNTAKQRLLEGKQIVGGTVNSPDPEIYCAVANAGFDYIWIDLQHSTLTYEEVAKMIAACPRAQAVPFIRVPDATESEIQKATDIGALGIIVPTVETLEKARAAVKWTKYPPFGRRSEGQGVQAVSLWGRRDAAALRGNDYKPTWNENSMVVLMIETPEGVKIAYEIASVPGVDVVFAASGDLANFSGKPPGSPEYEALVAGIHDATLKAGKKLGGPFAWKDRPGFSFFQGPGFAALVRAGAPAVLGNLGNPPKANTGESGRTPE
jgi:2-keto-3-deoxy-L-rhamnonate aldolase RhmA